MTPLSSEFGAPRGRLGADFGGFGYFGHPAPTADEGSHPPRATGPARPDQINSTRPAMGPFLPMRHIMRTRWPASRLDSPEYSSARLPT